jgi:TfoX/Sxy family transcriptional regulator of competence genes
MAYNELIDIRIRHLISDWDGTTAKKMFGGVCHLLHGNMVCGVHKDFLILRLGQEAAKKALHHPSTKPFDITGRPMKGWVMVAEDGFSTDDELRDWLQQAKTFVDTLPPK